MTPHSSPVITPFLSFSLQQDSLKLPLLAVIQFFSSPSLFTYSIQDFIPTYSTKTIFIQITSDFCLSKASGQFANLILLHSPSLFDTVDHPFLCNTLPLGF